MKTGVVHSGFSVVPGSSVRSGSLSSWTGTFLGTMRSDSIPGRFSLVPKWLWCRP